MGDARVLTLLVAQIRLLKHVLALVIEDEVRPLGVPALVRPEHDVVRRRVAERGQVVEFGPDLHVPAAALHVLLVLGLVLDNELFAFVAEGREGGSDSKESGVLGRLDALVFGLVLEPLACGGLPLPRRALALLPLAHRPAAFPAVSEGLGKMHLPVGQGGRARARQEPLHGGGANGGAHPPRRKREERSNAPQAGGTDA
mmetsp:Transcript_5399/g.12335  ORF Transcript_5399/g.12335 Transcript_5399/m.12335 type:complete len:200 (+) Transcript_5399:800-1399(+)